MIRYWGWGGGGGEGGWAQDTLSIPFPFLLNHLPPRQRYGEESWSVLKYLLSNFSGLLGHIAVIPINRHGFKG